VLLPYQDPFNFWWIVHEGFHPVIKLSKHKLTIVGMIGLHQGNDKIIDISFDILALEGLFLIPRMCSPLLSLNPYFGTLLPCLTAMTKVCPDVFPWIFTILTA